jgi:hypothetical protein
MARNYVQVVGIAPFNCRRVRRIATISFVMSIRLSVSQSASNNSTPTERIFIKFYICVFFENLLRKFKIH